MWRELRVRANFLCQLDWATESLDIGPNIILGMSVGVFLEEMSI